MQKSAGPVEIDPGELQTFADAFFSEHMQALHIPGLVFIFVQDGDVICSQGYGYADLDQQTPIKPDATIFRVGSVSKSFVATAVMQLVEQGIVDLDTDVNQYLAHFQIDNPFSKPVTLATILTHTAGFEDPPYASTTDPTQVEPLGEHLAASLPAVTHPPGEAHLYSNYGYALAALIVEEMSGIPFDQYVAEKIFQPLGMTQSSYLLAPPLPENLATGYFYQDGVQIPQPVDYDNHYPGGSIVSTAGDMAQFMLAHLGDGCTSEGCILGADSLVEMHRKQAETPYEGQNVTYGFVEGVFGDVRLVGHSGAIRGFGSSMNLIPEEDMGYFFVFNAECYETSACQIISEFRKAFVAQFFDE